MKLTMLLGVLGLALYLVRGSLDDNPKAENRFLGKWEVVAEFRGGAMGFSEYKSVELTADRFHLNEGRSPAGDDPRIAIEYKTAPESTPENELSLLAWYKEGSADGTPPGVPIMALRFQEQHPYAILKLHTCGEPVEDFKYHEEAAMGMILLVLKKSDL